LEHDNRRSSHCPRYDRGLRWRSKYGSGINLDSRIADRQHSATRPSWRGRAAERSLPPLNHELASVPALSAIGPCRLQPPFLDGVPEADVDPASSTAARCLLENAPIVKERLAIGQIRCGWSRPWRLGQEDAAVWPLFEDGGRTAGNPSPGLPPLRLLLARCLDLDEAGWPLVPAHAVDVVLYDAQIARIALQLRIELIGCRGLSESNKASVYLQYPSLLADKRCRQSRSRAALH